MSNLPEESKRKIGPLKIDLNHDNSLDNLGQQNIIDYTNHEPLLTSMDERGVGGPGTILLNNEPASRSPKPTDGMRPGGEFDKTTGDLAPGARKSNPILPTGIPLNGPNYLPTENMEAEFREGDHPRAPEGTSTGGQFVSKDGGSYPTGSSSEEKAARTKFFEPHKQTNLEIGELSHELSLTTLDRNIAKVRLTRALDRGEDTNDLHKEYDELARKVEKIKSDRDAKLKDLTDKKGLEGMEVQKALYYAKKEKQEAATHKPGSKVEMKHLMDSMAMEFRVDLIRRGKIPDKDFYGNNPYQSESPKPKPKHEIAKSFTTATKDHIKDFKHSAKVKLVGNIDTAHLDEVKKIWNNLSPGEAAGVENLVIKGSSSGQRKITVGEWKEGSKTLNVITHDRLTEKDYAETMHHEIGHKEYVTKTPEQIQKWQDAVKDILPPTEYAKFHRDRARKYENSWRNTHRYHNADEAEKKIIDSNVKVFTNLYHDEIHSEVVAHIRSGGLKEDKIYSKSGMESAVKSYKEIFE